MNKGNSPLKQQQYRSHLPFGGFFDKLLHGDPSNRTHVPGLPFDDFLTQKGTHGRSKAWIGTAYSRNSQVFAPKKWAPITMPYYNLRRAWLRMTGQLGKNEQMYMPERQRWLGIPAAIERYKQKQDNMAFKQTGEPIPYPDDLLQELENNNVQDPNQVVDPNQMMNYGGPINIYNNPVAYGGSGSGTGTTSGTTGLTIGQQGGMGMVGGAVGIIQGVMQSRQAKKQADRSRRQMKKERQKLREYENMYKNLDTSNPYMNMENTMEDLTINQKEAEFRRQQFEQSQSNIMEGLRGAAGGSGIGALAQSLAQQGQIASQQAAADIGSQEAYNIRARADMAGQIQNMERQGEVYSRGLKERQTTTLMGMQERRAMMREQELRQAQAMRQQAIGNIIGGVGNMAQSAIMMSDRKLKKNIKLIGKSPSGLNIYLFKYIDKIFGSGIYQGVMSDEVPNYAVINNGEYDMVDYSKIDVKFKEIK
jgi:hypothetical protein